MVGHKLFRLGINRVGDSNWALESVFTNLDSIIVKLLLFFLTITGKLFKALGKNWVDELNSALKSVYTNLDWIIVKLLLASFKLLPVRILRYLW